MNDEQVKIPRPLKNELKSLLEKDEPDLGKIGDMLLDLSAALLAGSDKVKYVEDLKRRWHQDAPQGIVPSGQKVSMDVSTLSNDVQSLASLKTSGLNHSFYLPDLDGVNRVIFSFREDAIQIRIGETSTRAVKEKFEKIP